MFLLSLIFIFQTQAARLSDLNVAHICGAEELSTDLLHQQSLITNSQWKDRLSTTKIFDADTTLDILEKSKIVRDGVTSEHIVNVLADGFKKIRLQEMEAIQRGEIKPIVDGRTYTHDELQKRKAMLDSFYQKNVQPILENLYRFYLSIQQERNRARKDLAPPEAVTKGLALVEAQVRFLNTNLKDLAPSVVKQFGKIKMLSLKIFL